MSAHHPPAKVSSLAISRFVRVPVSVLTHKNLTPGAKLFLAHILRWDWGAGCWVTDTQLSRELGVSERTIQNHTKALEKVGLLWVFEDREGMTVRLVVRPDHVYPKPVAIGDSKAGKIFSQNEARYKVLNHGLELHASTTTSEVGPNLVTSVASETTSVVSGRETPLVAKEPYIADSENKPEPETRCVPLSAIPETKKTGSAAFNAVAVPTLTEELAKIGIQRPVADALARKAPPVRVRAALRYVSGYRGEVLNPPGLVRHLLQTAAKLPSWCYPAEPKMPEKRIKPRSQTIANQIATEDRDFRRLRSPYAGLWERVCARIEGRIQKQSYKTWIVPTFIGRMDGGAIALSAPSAFFAEWIRENYLDVILKALVEEGVVVERLEVGM